MDLLIKYGVFANMPGSCRSRGHGSNTQRLYYLTLLPQRNAGAETEDLSDLLRKIQAEAKATGSSVKEAKA